MDSSVGKSKLTAIRIEDSYTGNWPAEVRTAIATLTKFVEDMLSAEDAAPVPEQADAGESGSTLRESAERATQERADAETAHPESFGTVTGVAADDAASLCGAVDEGTVTVESAPEIILVRGRDAYELVDQAFG